MMQKIHEPIWKALLIILITSFTNSSFGQKPVPPIPVEAFFGHKAIYSQLVFKRPFTTNSKFAFFNLSTYSASYVNEMSDNSLIMINQISFNYKKGFGIMAGADMNSVVGISPIIGPQHNYASKKILAVTVLSYFMNGDSDLKLFGLYEYKPPINENWSIYSRVQFIYNQNLSEGTHNKSYLYLRAGVKRNALIFGLAANLDQSGPQKFFRENYGAFVRWEF